MAEKKGIGSILGQLTDRLGITETQGEGEIVESSVPDSLVPSIADDSDQAEEASTPAPAPTGGDPQVRKQILTELAKTEPPAYAAFSSMMAELAEDIPDSSKRVKIAFKSLKAQNIKPADVLGAFDAKLDSVDSYESAFKATVKSRTETDVAAHEKEAAKTEKLIAEKEAEIEQLKNEMKELDDARVKHLETAKNAALKINTATKRVINELGSIRSSIRKEKDMVSDLAKESK